MTHLSRKLSGASFFSIVRRSARSTTEPFARHRGLQQRGTNCRREREDPRAILPRYDRRCRRPRRARPPGLRPPRQVALDRHERGRLRRKIDRHGSHAAHPSGQHHQDDDLRDGHGIGKEGRFQFSDRAVTLVPPGALDGIRSRTRSPWRSCSITRAVFTTSTARRAGISSRTSFPIRGTGTRLWTAAELLAYAKKAGHRPTGRPGEKKSYSSTGYIVLEMIVENVESKPFPQLFREHLFEPLGMKSAGVEGADFGAA